MPEMSRWDRVAEIYHRAASVEPTDRESYVPDKRTILEVRGRLVSCAVTSFQRRFGIIRPRVVPAGWHIARAG